MMPIIHVVGIDDPYNRTPLEPTIPNSSGNRLWLMTGLSLEKYKLFFHRHNLFDDDGMKRTLANSKHRARDLRARILSKSGVSDYHHVICLGHIVSVAFGVTRRDYFRFHDITSRMSAVRFPHPSGLNRWYNDKENRDRAEKFMHKMAEMAQSEMMECPSCHEISLCAVTVSKSGDEFVVEYSCDECTYFEVR